MDDLPKLLQELNIDSSIISREDLKILVTGIPVSESEDDFSESHSLARWTPEPRGHLDSDRIPKELRHVKDDYERQLRELIGRIKDLQIEKRTLEDALEAARTNNKNEIRAYQQSTAQVYEKIKVYKDSHDSNRKELDDLRTEYQITKEKLQRTEKELIHHQAHSGSYVKDLERKHEELVSENSRIHKQLDLVAKTIEENREKASRFDEIDRELKKEIQNRYKLENQVEVQLNQITQLSRNVEDSRILLDNKNKELDLLSKDKSYLSKQNSSLQDKLQRLEDRNDRLEIEIVEAKNSAQSYLNRLLDTKTERSTQFEEKFRKEISDLRDRHSKELDQIKTNLNEVHEKRVEYLLEAKEAAERKLLRLEQDYKDKSEAYDMLMLEFRSTQNRMEESLQELRSELRIKSEDLERTHNIYEDTLNAHRHSREENELLKAKVDVLRQEFYKSESKCTQENAELKAQLAVAKENLMQYALIEQELDEAIKNQDIEGIQAPTTSKRRIQQSLELAKQLKDKQKQLDSIRNQNLRLSSDLETCTNELTFAKKLLNQTEQPYGYLIKQLEEKEKETSELRRSFNKSQQKLSEISSEYDILAKKNSELENDIKQILSKKDAIESLKTMLGQLTNEDVPSNTVKNKNDNQAPAWFKTLKRRLNQ
jgi:progesterone-induced-blocking factor 1